MSIRRMLSGIAEAMWPRERLEPQSRALPIFLGVSLSVVLLLVLRRLDGVTNPQFWAEDGLVFFQENLKGGCWRALQTFFKGFPYFGQRLVACAASPVRFAWAPHVYNAVAYLVAAGCLATFSLPAFRHVIRSDALRVAFCLAVAAMPPAKELVGSLTNTSWFLSIWLMLLTIARLPQSRIGLSALAGGIVLATFSTPLVVLTAPPWLARALYAARGRRRRDACLSAIALAALFALVVLAGDLGRRGAVFPPLFVPMLNAISTRVLAALVLDPATVESLVTRFGPGAVYAIAIAVLALLIALAWRRQRPIGAMLLYCAYGALASFWLAFVGFPHLAHRAASLSSLFETRGWALFAGRYQVLALSMAYLALLVIIDRLPGGRRWSVASVLLLVWLAATQAPTFVLPPYRDLQWPAHAVRLERKLAEQSPQPLLIPINPDPMGVFFHVALDRRALAPETEELASLAELLHGTAFEQSFVARCPRLSEIDLWLETVPDRAPANVLVQLADAKTGHVEASFVRTGAELETTTPKQVLYFPPILESRGRAYRISITAQGGAPGDTIAVFGSTEDAYPDGEARRDGAPMAGDLSFRYGCTID